MPEPLTHEQLGRAFLRRVLHLERVLRTVDRLLGGTLELGPIGAGPGRAFATVSIHGTYHPTTGEELPGDLLAYRVLLPITVDFDLDMVVDRHRYHADVVVPLVLTAHPEEPLAVRWNVALPAEDEVRLTLGTDTRRGSVLQRVAGIETELRRFLVKVVAKELEKPYVRRATHLDLERIVDAAWPAIEAQIVPADPADRHA